MQGEVDNLQAELKRKEGDIGIINTEKDRLINRMKVEEGKIFGAKNPLGQHSARTMT